MSPSCQFAAMQCNPSTQRRTQSTVQLIVRNDVRTPSFQSCSPDRLFDACEVPNAANQQDVQSIRALETPQSHEKQRSSHTYHDWACAASCWLLPCHLLVFLVFVVEYAIGLHERFTHEHNHDVHSQQAASISRLCSQARSPPGSAVHPRTPLHSIITFTTAY